MIDANREMHSLKLIRARWVAEWVRASDWRPGGPESESRFATSLRNFGNSVYPASPVYFGGDTKSRRSLPSGVYAEGSKRSHQSALEMRNLSWTPPLLVLGRVQTGNFTRRANRSRIGLPVFTLRPLRRVRPVHSDHIRMCSQWTRTVRVGLALQCECSSGRVGRIG